MKVSATLVGKPDSFGRRKIYLRIADKDKRTFQATDIKVKPSDFLKGKVKSSHLDHVALNRKLLSQIMEVERLGKFKGQETPVISFYDYSINLLRIWDKQKHFDTLRHYKSSLTKFNEFAPGILLSKVTSETLQNFQDYCYRLGNKSNTVWTTFRFMRLIIRRAIKEGKIKENPFNLFDMPKYRDPKKIYLTEIQIKAIEKVWKSKVPEEIKFAAAWFLLGVFTGIRFRDMTLFDRKKNIKNNRLIFYTSKTGEVVGLPMTEKIKKLFESIDYRPLNLTNEYYNRLLKQVQGLAEIEDNLTAHVSRHTAAVRWANAGISQEVVSKLLGHSSLRTTSIYFKITNQRIDQELKKIK